jgi:hypothetical protein
MFVFYFRVVFCPMSEISGAVKQFTITINQQYTLHAIDGSRIQKHFDGDVK